MAVSDQDSHMYCTNKFIELANELRGQEIDVNLINGALMTASGIYATYVAAGNDGVLEASGVKKVGDLYLRTLKHHQKIKKADLKERSKS
jgi:hypothetical protein